jgi:hypothetical protein
VQRGDARHVFEPAVLDPRSIAEASKAGARDGNGSNVSVDAEDGEIGPGFEYRRRMTCTADGGVDDQPARDR